MTFEAGDVVVVPFPFVDRNGAKRRPALVLSKRQFNQRGHTTMAMITTQSFPPWPGDYIIGDLDSAGLSVTCRVRLKLFTLDNRLILKGIGRLSVADRGEVMRSLRQLFL